MTKSKYKCHNYYRTAPTGKSLTLVRLWRIIWIYMLTLPPKDSLWLPFVSKMEFSITPLKTFREDTVLDKYNQVGKETDFPYLSIEKISMAAPRYFTYTIFFFFHSHFLKIKKRGRDSEKWWDLATD